MKRKLPVIIISSVALLIVLFIVMKYVVLWPGFYNNNKSLDKDENREIKSLLLSTMKNNHSKIFLTDNSKLYTKEYITEYNPEDKSSNETGVFVGIDSNFMDSVEKTNDNEYTAKVQLYYPDDWCYYFTVKVIDGKYVVSYLEIDP